MIVEEDKRLDQLFKKRLSDTDNSFAYNEEDWNKLEVLMNQKEKRRRFLTWMRVCTTIAALALLFIGFWVFKVEPPLINDTQKFSNKKKSVDDSQLKTNQLTELRKIQPDLRNVPNIIYPLNAQKDTTSALTLNNVTVIDSNIQSNLQSNLQRIAALIAPRGNAILVLDTVQSMNQVLKPPAIPKKNIPSFAISAIASSDINGVNSLNKGKVGSNFGMLLSMSLTKRLTLQTGISYARKPYEIEYVYTNPYAYKVNPLSASANCEMLDIPLDINYAVLNKPKDKITIGTGLSSYMMLNENYSYNYGSTAKANTTTYVIATSKSYLWSMLNVTAAYQHKLGANLGILVQPYLKIPLKEVGYSNVKLHSAGVSMGLQMNINRKK